MLKLPFRNYEEFSEIFGERFGVRKNRIMLSLWKSRDMLRAGISQRVGDMQDLERVLMDEIEARSEGDCEVHVLGRVIRSNVYSTDHKKGVCDEFAPGHVRVIKHETNPVRDRLVKSKTGKLLRALILETEFGKKVPDEVIIYLCEQFSSQWSSWIMEKYPQYRLSIDDNFEKIYSQEDCRGDFHSCMVNRGRHKFYALAVKSKAAYLLDRDNKVVARAIIFEDVKDQDGQAWRLCERQYSSGGDESLKRLLVNKLIAGNYIDGYKSIGAGCSESRSFVANNGSSLRNKLFWISCTLQLSGYNNCAECDEEILSYQDSFKWYDSQLHLAYNFEPKRYNAALDTTDESVRGFRNYDEYHDRYTSSRLVSVYIGRTTTCADDELEDFLFSKKHQIWIHKSYFNVCPWCGRHYFAGTEDLEAEFVHSELTDCDYCSQECRKEAEDEYRRNNLYSEILDKYFESKEALEEAESAFKRCFWAYSELLDECFETDEELEAAEAAFKANHTA